MGRPVKLSDRSKPWYQHSLERKTGTRPFRQRVLIVCEGERTEPNYFETLRRLLPRDVVAVIEGTGRNTRSLVEEAIRLRDKESGGDRPYDQTWAVFDKDDFAPDDFDNAIQMCAQHKIKAAYSNQAFELWYILHFQDRQTGMDRSEYKRHLSKHLGESYKKNDPAMYQKLHAKGNEDQAIRRARRLKNNAPHPPSSANPCTTVFQLVEELNGFLPPAHGT